MMHELSIAMSIIEGATEEAHRHGAIKVNAVHLKLGALSGVTKDALLFSYELACEGTALEGSRLVIEEVPAVVFCSSCEIERALTSTQRMCCPVCGALTTQVEGGRELELVALEIAT
jgi:hydrogenase nickel incorporation protein HypA/HybF